MAEDLEAAHKEQIVSYLRFAKYQREQAIKCVKAAIEDTKDPRLIDDTFTLDEVEDTLSAVTEAVVSEVEAELINSSHTNVLLLKQVFSQAEKWHLNLETDLSEVENRELLNAVREWEETQSKETKVEPATLEKKRLAPLNEGGPAQLLNIQIQKIELENAELKARLKTVEKQAMDAMDERSNVKRELEQTKIELAASKNQEPEVIVQDNTEEIQQLTETMEEVKLKLEAEKELALKSQKEMEDDLTSAKHRYLEIQHQLTLAEKELEKKFSETGAYRNFKKMLHSKNETIKVLRKKLQVYEPEQEAED